MFKLFKIRFLLCFVALATSITGYSQSENTETQSEEKVFQIVDEMPFFKEGDAAMFKYLAENIKYPASATENKEQGLIFVSFIVGKSGEVINPVILQGVYESLNAEAIRVVESMDKKWNPGKQNGEIVKVRYNLPIRFTLGK